MNITHDEERFSSFSKRVEELAKIIDEHAFMEKNIFHEDDKDDKSFHHPKNVYWADRRVKALELAKKIIKNGYIKV